ncbi:hypothetical protein FOCG_11555 [Fusarium oxysporum f. sp. radicis-lycopersici 26381]|uniref:Uncharacterized protein n=1 Tax=Fusarium oxysporum Fo47 TaxID=660027 RepID=W9KZN9_FUSOX|nr:hypothetical protein FOZG_02649 [Fusarium oxysporum Fo47]EWZ84536.1 hypothetical protein FOWG_12311 [Fusarium oxysporum f. sp. lycopersici MN25]EXL47364.1 hypothetical protein FOCG_11555 [Fusarium oxysporum f. sp. radicis-lycopersici 26381]
MARSSKRQESCKTPDRPSGEAMGGPRTWIQPLSVSNYPFQRQR